jgi:hypothetical protein
VGIGVPIEQLRRSKFALRMRKQLVALLILVLALPIVSCARTVENFEASSSDKGLVVIGYRWENAPPLGFGGVTMSIKPYNPQTRVPGAPGPNNQKHWSPSLARPTGPGPNYLFLEMAPGGYMIDHLNGIGLGGEKFDCTPLTFEVQRGEIVYVGDFSVERNEILSHAYDVPSAERAVSARSGIKGALVYRQPIEADPEWRKYQGSKTAFGTRLDGHPCRYRSFQSRVENEGTTLTAPIN